MTDTDVNPPFDRDATAAKYYPRVTAYARKLAGRCPQWFEEAEGEATVALAKALNNFDGSKGGDFQTYVMQVVRSRVRRRLAQLAKQAAERPAVVPLLDDIDEVAKPEPARRALSADTIEKLKYDAEARRAVELVFCEGWSHREAGLLLGVSKAQVGVLLKRAAEAIGPDPHWDKV